MTASPMESSRSFYKFGERVLIEEDQYHEFKAHKDLSIEDISQVCKDHHSRQSISRTICAFLNTGKGGIVYMGILDSGVVNGLHLTKYQKDHILLSLENVLTRYDPPVAKHMYNLRFVPVIPEGATTLPPQPQSPEPEVNGMDRQRPHEVQSSRYCWCDNEASAQISVGGQVGKYVVEVEVFPWSSSDPRNKPLNTTKMGIHPMFENEEGICFIRRQGSNIRCTMQDVIDMTRQEVKAYYSLPPEMRKPL
ncbi:uncharacterized protein ISCGN_032804 [Ixodes scapularis]